MDCETIDEIKRHFNVVAESLRSEIRTVSESLDDCQNRLSTMFERVREEFSEVKSIIRPFIP